MRAIILAILDLCAIFAAVTGGVYVGEIKATHYLQREVVAAAKAQEDSWLRWQRDQIDQYERQHSGSRPETKDFSE